MLGKQKYIKGCKSDPVNDLLCEREEQSLNLLCERVLIVKMSSVPLFLKDPNDCTIANFYNSLTFDDLKLGGKGWYNKRYLNSNKWKEKLQFNSQH